MWFIGKLSRDKRGAGSIIGAVFIVLILLSGFTFYTLNVNTTEHYNETLDSMSELDWNRNRENIVIKEVETTDENKLNVTVENESPILAHVILLGIFNKTDNTQQYSSLNEYIEPAETENIVSDSTVIEGKKYVIQLVTELGNTIEHKFYPASEVNCKLTLITAPPTAYEGNNITVLLIVTHNDTEVDTIQNVTVSLEAEPTGLVEVKEEPSSLTVVGLQKGESAFFRWVYNTTDTGTVTFNATYEQAPTGTYALSTVEIISPLGDGEGESKYDFVDEEGDDPIGSHSLFSAQQAGPDGIVDTLLESNTGGDPEEWVSPSGYEDPNNQWSDETNAYDDDTGTHAENDVPKYRWSKYLVLTLSGTITCGKIRYYIDRENADIDQVEIDIYDGTWTIVYIGAGTWNAWTNVSFTETSVTKMRFKFYNENEDHPREAFVCEADFLQSGGSANYELDLEVRWTEVDHDETNEWLCIYGGTMGSEDILVDVWNGTAWINVFTNLSSGWNSLDVSSYLVSSTFTIRFRGGTETGDVTEDKWEIDATFLYVWS